MLSAFYNLKAIFIILQTGECKFREMGMGGGGGAIRFNLILLKILSFSLKLKFEFIYFDLICLLRIHVCNELDELKFNRTCFADVNGL